MNRAILAMFDTYPEAEAVIDRLVATGFLRDNVSVLFPDRGGRHDVVHEHHTKAPEGAVAGASAGSVVGGTLGLLAGVGALAIPGLGALLVAGPIVAALSGVAVGGAVGGFTGALVGMGVPEIQAKVYDGKVRDGNLLVAVHIDDRLQVSVVKRILREGGAHDVCTTFEAEVPDSSPQPLPWGRSSGI